MYGMVVTFIPQKMRHLSHYYSFKFLLPQIFPGEPMGARLELFIRIVMTWVLGIILSVWGIWSGICMFLQWWIILFTGKRNQDLHKHIEKWFKFFVKSQEYLNLLTDKRPL